MQKDAVQFHKCIQSILICLDFHSKCIDWVTHTHTHTHTHILTLKQLYKTKFPELCWYLYESLLGREYFRKEHWKFQQSVCKHKYFTTNIIKRCIKNSAAAYHQNAELNTDCV